MIASDRTNPLFDDWQTYLSDPRAFWSGDAQTVATRARSLETDFPIVCGMVQTRLLGTHGPNGLRYASQYCEDADPATSPHEIAQRRAIDDLVAAQSPFVAADGGTRANLEWELDRAAIIDGEGWAVRVWREDPRAPLASCWRQVNFWQICNPRGERNNATQQDGIRYDTNGAIKEVFVASDTWSSVAGITSGEGKWISWRTPDGMPNVLYRRGWLPRGGARCLSELTPMIFSLRMLQGVDQAYVATKRVHASHPLTIQVSDLKAARELYKGTKLANLLIDRNHSVTFNNFDFKGDDYTAWFNVQARNLMSAWGQPWELVLCDHSAKSGASARSLWQQYYMRCHRWQDEHGHEVTNTIDEVIIREGAARGLLDIRAPWHLALRGTLIRPPEPMPDPLKEIQIATAKLDLGYSPNSILADLGDDFAAETMQKARDIELCRVQNVAMPGATAPAAPAAPAAPTGQPVDDAATTQTLDPVADPAADSTVDNTPVEGA